MYLKYIICIVFWCVSQTTVLFIGEDHTQSRHLINFLFFNVVLWYSLLIGLHNNHSTLCGLFADGNYVVCQKCTHSSWNVYMMWWWWRIWIFNKNLEEIRLVENNKFALIVCTIPKWFRHVICKGCIQHM